jgi:hypothetical protein
MDGTRVRNERVAGIGARAGDFTIGRSSAHRAEIKGSEHLKVGFQVH